MTIETIMSRRVHHCRPDHTLDFAAARMWEHDCGSLPVCVADDGEPRVIGMLTDRDVCMAALFQGKPLHELKVADAMSRAVSISRPDDRPLDVELLMRERRIRRVPVADDGGALVGIVSLADLARVAQDGASSHGAGGAAALDVGHTLATICEPSSARVDPPI
jgi:CBS domain-containing protein